MTDSSETGSAESGEPPRRPSWRWLGLYPFEICALASLVMAVAYLRRIVGLRIGWRTVESTIYPMFQGLPFNLFLGIALVSLYTWLARRGLVAYWRQLLSPGWWLLWIRLWLACMLMGYVYFWIKVNVPLLNHRLWDSELWQLDALLHLEVSPSIFITQLCKGTLLLPFLDHWYSWWISTVIAAFSFFCAFAETRVRSPFMLSAILLWTAGAWLYLALPALGPIYVFPQPWAELEGALPLADAGQRVLWENYQIMLAGRSGQIYEFNPTRGVAALPSLHVGAHGLFALWAWRHVRVLFVPFLVATLLTFLGSILTGWHYAIDGYVGLILAWISYRIALRWDAGDREKMPRVDDDDSPRGSSEARTPAR